jgi:hypothetical protein
MMAVNGTMKGATGRAEVPVLERLASEQYS